MTCTPESRMPSLDIDPGLQRACAEFTLPARLGFGQCMAPVMFRADYDGESWGQGRLLPYGPVALDPAAKVLHYAQVVFEGLKACRVAQSRPALFRPRLNAQRINASAQRMMIPELPETLFMTALCAVSAWCEPFIPRAGGSSLYLRPLVYGTQPALGLGPSDTYTFLVLASPSEALAPGALRIRVEREGARAAPGGTGAVKISGNYGASLYATAAAAAAGFHQPLWLDAESRRFIEELSVMNLFAVMDGVLHTPALNDTILPGITRASIIELARAAGLPVQEQRMDIAELLAAIDSGRCSEIFACGTAVIVAPVSGVGDMDGRVYELQHAPGPVTTRLRDELLAIQEGRAADRFGWMHAVGPEYGPQVN